jgi:diguanylate cyclase (GGDEF)-like protein/PAS domain S-box-containing protein
LRPHIFPGSKLSRRLIAPRDDLSPAITSELTAGLFTSIPIFLGGVLNSIAVAALAATRHPTAPFFLWLFIEIVFGVVRLAVVVAGRRSRALGGSQPVRIAMILSCAWAASVGFGAYISLSTTDWVVATIACVSAAGMVSGICLRNFGTPRLVAVMMVLSLGPCAVGAFLSPEPILLIIAVQLPVLMIAIGSAGFRLNAMMVARMSAQEALERSEALNRSILDSSPDFTLLLDETGQIALCNGPPADEAVTEAILGKLWLDILPEDSRTEGERALERAATGDTARMTVRYEKPQGSRWFDLAVSRIGDCSGRVLIVARDISHQKQSEERALWMATHDPLTGLPNRIVLQEHLDRLSTGTRTGTALLVLDVDDFKLINDTLGHDAGDHLLCAFAERLARAVRSGDLVARLGGDEFAVLLRARSEQEVEAAGDKIFAQLREPFAHDGRRIECNASIGASLHPRDGAGRSELMKAADIALYSAKAAGRGRLKIFRGSMREAFERRTAMVFMARRALTSDDILPHYQPKVCLRTGRILGFEALLRWRDSEGALCLPESVKAAFDDPALSEAINDRMIDRCLADMSAWIDGGVDFGHVAINCSAAAFRSRRLADELLEKLGRRRIPLDRVQLEVTETVFLGRGSEHVKDALGKLHDAGIRIALDDFGTGHAALLHLMQFPVDALKIDRSFIAGLGRNGEAEAITKAIVGLGVSLGIEVIAEGVESPEQQLALIGLGCRTGQGYLYSKAIPREMVPAMLTQTIARRA